MNLAVAASPARSPDPSRTSRGPPPHSTGRPARIRPPALGSVQLLQCFPLSCKCHIQCFGLLYFVPRAWCPCIAGGVGLMGAACGSVAGGLTGERRKSRHLYNVFALPSFLVLRSGGGFKCVALDVFPHGHHPFVASSVSASLANSSSRGLDASLPEDLSHFRAPNSFGPFHPVGPFFLSPYVPLAVPSAGGPIAPFGGGPPSLGCKWSVEAWWIGQNRWASYDKLSGGGIAPLLKVFGCHNPF